MANQINSINCRAKGAVTQHTIVALAASAAADGIPDCATGTAVSSPATHNTVGPALSTVGDNEMVEVQVCGVATCIAGEALTLGTNHSVASGADGKCFACAANDKQVGIFLGALKGSATAAAGDFILVALSQGHYEG